MRLLVLLLLILASPALAQLSPSGFPDATLPLDGLDEVAFDQGSGCSTHTLPCATKRAPSTRFGQPLVQAAVPTSPFTFQTWWDTSGNPAVYKIYNGSTWVAIYQADTVTGIPSFPGNVYLPTGYLALGTTTTVPNWPITLFENNSSSGATGITINGYENGSGVTGDNLRGFSARGSLASPTAAQANDVLLGLHGSGFWSGKPLGYFVGGDARAAIELQAAENFVSSTNNGTQIIFKTTPTISSTMVEVGRFDANGLLGIGTTSPNFGVTLSRNNPIPAGGVTQGFTANTYENASGLTGGGFRSFAARGTASVPTALVANDPILVLSGSGFWTGKAAGSWASVDGRATIAFNAAENWAGVTNNGTYMAFSTTATGAGSQTERMRLNGSGGLGVGTTTDPGANNILVAGVVQAGATDVGLSRTAAASLALGNGTSGNSTGTLKLTSVAIVCTTFAARPGAPAAGQTACFTDSNTATWGATIAGGGANSVQARYNGTNWTVVGI